MQCNFTLSHDSKTYEAIAERVALDDTLETWRVSTGVMSTVCFIALTNNHPDLHARHHYKAFYKWMVLESDHTYRCIVDVIINYVEYYIKGLWKPPKKMHG